MHPSLSPFCWDFKVEFCSLKKCFSFQSFWFKTVFLQSSWSPANTIILITALILCIRKGEGKLLRYLPREGRETEHHKDPAGSPWIFHTKESSFKAVEWWYMDSWEGHTWPLIAHNVDLSSDIFGLCKMAAGCASPLEFLKGFSFYKKG